MSDISKITLGEIENVLRDVPGDIASISRLLRGTAGMERINAKAMALLLAAGADGEYAGDGPGWLVWAKHETNLADSTLYHRLASGRVLRQFQDKAVTYRHLLDWDIEKIYTLVKLPPESRAAFLAQTDDVWNLDREELRYAADCFLARLNGLPEPERKSKDSPVLPGFEAFLDTMEAMEEEEYIREIAAVPEKAHVAAGVALSLLDAYLENQNRTREYNTAGLLAIQKELEKKLRRLERIGDSAGIAKLFEPEIKFLDHKLTSGGAMSIYQQVSLTFREPVTIKDSAICIYQKADSLWKPIPFEIEHDTVDILRYDIYAEWKPEETFKITIDSASIVGLYGLHNNKIESTLRFNALNQYSTLTVNVANPKPGYTVRLHNGSGTVLRSDVVENGSVDFFLVQPGTYFVSMFDDANGNGKWDTGEYEEKRHAESVWYIKRSWILKQDWTHETDAWNVNDTPLTEQKPDELQKEKAKKKDTDIHKKNVERLEKKTKQIESEKKKKERKRKERKERRQKNKDKYREIRANAKEQKAKAKNPVPESDAGVEIPDVEEVTTPNE